MLLQGMLGNHEKDKNTLITTKAKLKVVNKELEEMRWSHEVLQQKYNQVRFKTNPRARLDILLPGEQGTRGDPGEILNGNP